MNVRNHRQMYNKTQIQSPDDAFQFLSQTLVMVENTESLYVPRPEHGFLVIVFRFNTLVFLYKQRSHKDGVRVHW